MDYEGPRGTRPSEFGKVMDLVDGIFLYARLKGTTNENAFPLLYNKKNLSNMRIMLYGGRPVSHVGVTEIDALLYGCRIRIGMIGAVCTHPDHRRKGLAGKILADSMERLHRDGVDFVIISGIRTLYDRNNCVMAGVSYQYNITGSNVDKLSAFPCEVTKFEMSRLDELIAIHQCESVRYFRSYEEFAALLSEKAYRRPKTFLIELGGRSIAYVCMEVLQGKEDSGLVVEYAGSRVAIASALPKLLDLLRLKSITLSVPHHDFELLAVLSHLRKPKSSHFGGTMRIINPEGFMRKLKPYLVSRYGGQAGKLTVNRTGDKCVISFGGEGHILRNEKALTWLFFGQPEEVEDKYAHYLRPFRIQHKGELGRALALVFPLPTFLYGLNYT